MVSSAYLRLLIYFLEIFLPACSSSSPALQSDFGVDHLVMSMCRAFSCVVGRGYLLWPVHLLGKTLLSFPCFIPYSKAKFAHYSRCFLTSYFCIPVPCNEKDKGRFLLSPLSLLEKVSPPPSDSDVEPAVPKPGAPQQPETFLPRDPGRGPGAQSRVLLAASPPWGHPLSLSLSLSPWALLIHPSTLQRPRVGQG